jgi:hypothetical protein
MKESDRERESDVMGILGVLGRSMMYESGWDWHCTMGIKIALSEERRLGSCNICIGTLPITVPTAPYLECALPRTYPSYFIQVSSTIHNASLPPEPALSPTLTKLLCPILKFLQTLLANTRSDIYQTRLKVDGLDWTNLIHGHVK